MEFLSNRSGNNEESQPLLQPQRESIHSVFNH